MAYELVRTNGDSSVFSICKTAMRIQIDIEVHGSNAAITHREIACGGMSASKFIGYREAGTITSRCQSLVNAIGSAPAPEVADWPYT